MRALLIGLAALLLGACAADPYRYHDDGYWSAAPAPRAQFSFSIGSGYCSPWYGPFSYAPIWSAGYGCGGFSLGRYYGGYYDPFWAYYVRPWYPRPYWHGHDDSRMRAYDASRRLSRDLEHSPWPASTRYGDLAPRRGRDLGPGGSYSSQGYGGSLRSAPSGYGGRGSRSRNDAGLGSVSRGSSSADSGRSQGSAPSNSRMESASPRSRDRDED